MKGFSFWQTWLLAAGFLIAAFGIVMALLNGTAFFDLFNRQIDPVFWGTQSPPAAAAAFQRWVYGVWGATIAGWGVFVGFMAHHPFRRRERWSWYCLAAGLAVWYTLDTAISIGFGVHFNAIFNTALLVVVGMPLVFTRAAFFKASAVEQKAGA